MLLRHVRGLRRKGLLLLLLLLESRLGLVRYLLLRRVRGLRRKGLLLLLLLPLLWGAAGRVL